LFVASFAAPLDKAKKVVRRALDLGINYIDTAPSYGNSEEVLGIALEGLTRPLVLSTKLGGRPLPFRPQDKKALYASVEESLRLMKREAVDILFVHEPDRPGQYDWWKDPERYTGPVLEVIEDLKRRGLIHYSGFGGTTAYELARIIRAGSFDVVLTAYNYSLLWREASIDIIPAAKKKGMGIIAGSPLQQGALARRYDEEVKNGAPWLSPPRREQLKALYRYLDEIQMDIAEAGIRFVISNPDVSCVLMGASDPLHVEKNVAFIEKGPLPKEMLSRLDQIAATVPFRPFEEPFNLGWFLANPGIYTGPTAARWRD
jgi:aryl-alcohol dehydrogenase-like predicted oxidoreductase